MQDSTVNSYQLPNTGSDRPAVLAAATDVAFRVVVSNVGPIAILLAHDSATLQAKSPFARTFLLPAGKSEVFVLAPKQSLLACGEGTGGVVSVAVSAAIAEGFHA